MVDKISSSSAESIQRIKDIAANEDYGYAHKFALIQLQLAKDNYEQVEAYMALIDAEQKFQQDGQKYIDEISQYINDINGMSYDKLLEHEYVLIPQELARAMDDLFLPEDAEKIYDDKGNLVGMVCSKKSIDAWENNIQPSIDRIEARKNPFIKDRDTKQARLNEVEKELSKRHVKNKTELENEQKWLKGEIKALDDKIAVFDGMIDEYHNLEALDLKNLTTDCVYVDNLPDDIIQLCKDFDIKLPETVQTKDGKTVYKFEDIKKLGDAIKEKQGNMEQKIQSDMTYLQNYLAQYNSYLEGAGKTYSDLSVIGQSVAKNLG